MLRHVGGAIATASIMLLLAGCGGNGPSTAPVDTKSAQAIETVTGPPAVETPAIEARTAGPTVAGPYLGQPAPGLVAGHSLWLRSRRLYGWWAQR